MFTREELEEMRRADEEIEASFRLSPEDLARSRRLDRVAVLDGMDGIARQKAAQKKAYREANREKVAAYQRNYRRKRNAASGGKAPETAGNCKGITITGL